MDSANERFIKGRFQPGQSGNPGGKKRSKGFVTLLHQRYGHNAEVLVDRLERFSNPPKGMRVPVKIQFEATIALTEHHSGRSVQRIDVSHEQPETLRIVVTDDAAPAPDAEPGLSRP